LFGDGEPTRPAASSNVSTAVPATSPSGFSRVYLLAALTGGVATDDHERAGHIGLRVACHLTVELPGGYDRGGDTVGSTSCGAASGTPVGTVR